MRSIYDNDPQLCRGCGLVKPVCCGSGRVEDTWCPNYCQSCCKYHKGQILKSKMMASDELKVTKDRVVAAAAKCGDAASVLKELFPEAFAEPVFDLLGDLTVSRKDLPSCIVSKRTRGNLAGKGFHLPRSFDWMVRVDNENELVLVPSAKAGAR